MAKKKSTKQVSAPMPLTQYENLKLSQLRLSSMNPRKTFSDEAIRELSESIRHQGLLQPITVRPIPGVVTQNNEQVYEIVCGARRYKAMLLIEAETVPSIIRDMTDAEALDAMIVENLQRKDVDPLEEAEAFRLLLDQGQSVADLALRFGKSERYVRDRCKLNELVPELREAFHQKKLPLSGAIMLARLPQSRQTEFADDNCFAVNADWSNTDNITISDVKEYITENLPYLDNAAFLSVPEESWNVKKVPRLCANCALNSSCQLSLFPELADSAVCGDPDCYQKKNESFVWWLLETYKKDFISPANGFLSIDLAPDNAFVLISSNDKWSIDRLQPAERALYDEIIKKYSDKCLILPLWENGVRRPYQRDDELKKMIEHHKVVKGISLLQLVQGQFEDFEWFTIPYTDKETEEDKVEKKADELAQEYRSMENKERLSVNDELFNIFCAMESEREDGLQWWERAIMAGALLTRYYEDTPMLDGKKEAQTIAEYEQWWQNKPAFHQEREMLIEYFKNNPCRQRLLISLMEFVDPDAVKDAKDMVKSQIDSRRAEIEAELREMGYDVNGCKLTDDE